jgi:predicted phage terminase large subunit-like protein
MREMWFWYEIVHETVTPALFAITASRGRWQAADHLLMLSDKLTQVAAGKLKRLMVFMPPRHGKSEMISKYFPAWYLGHHPDHRVILSSYEADFAASWGWKARNILEEYGSKIFGVTVNPESSARNRWDVAGHEGGMNTAGAGGPITGKGAHLFIIDDPIKNSEEAHSEIKREKLWEWYQSTAYTRLEPDGAIIIIHTRWHQDDLGGRLLDAMERGGDQWGILNFPARAEENDLLGRKVGEPLWKERYSLNALSGIEEAVGQYYWHAMYQQSPYTKTGGMFERTWFEIVDEAPRHSTQVRFWDLAATEAKKGSDPDWTVGVLMAHQGSSYYVKDVVRVRKKPGDVEMLIQQTAQLDGMATRIYMEQEPGSSGKGMIHTYAKLLAGYAFYGIPSSGSKTVRAQPLSAAASRGDVKVVNAVWLNAFLSELELFPNGAHDDQVDATSGAYNILTGGGDSSRFRVAGAERKW